jgi:chromosome segregation ATPase
MLSTREPIQDQDDTARDEARMRKALGDMGASSQSQRAPSGFAAGMTSNAAWQPRQQRRFVREGEVRVETVNSQGRSPETAALTKRLRDAEAALQIERTERERTERSLEQAMEAKRQLEKHVWHEASARDEAEKALAAARAASVDAQQSLEEREALRGLLEASRTAEKAARRALRNLEAAFEKERAALASESEAHAVAVQTLEAVQSALAASELQLTLKSRELAKAVAKIPVATQRKAPKPVKASGKKLAVKPLRAKGVAKRTAAKPIPRKLATGKASVRTTGSAAKSLRKLPTKAPTRSIARAAAPKKAAPPRKSAVKRPATKSITPRAGQSTQARKPTSRSRR